MENIIKRTVIFFFILYFLVISINLASSTQTYLTRSNQWETNLTKIHRSALAWGDIDNDNDVDLVITGDCGTNCRSSKIYLNNGTSLVESSQWGGNLTAVLYGSLAFGDINNDGDLDLALSGCAGEADFVDTCTSGAIRTFIYLNNGTSLVESSQWQQNLTKTYRPGSLAFGDIDNDGDLDLIQSGQTENSIMTKAYINNGTSLVESSQWQNNLIAIREGAVIFGDIDNDEDLDLIISGRDASSNKLTKAYINNGTSLVESSQWQGDLVNVQDSSLAFADFDNDGDLDLSLTGCCDKHRIYRNNGSTFIEINREITGGLTGVFAGSQAFGDYDADGYLDLITNGRETYTTLYLYNVSNTNFTINTNDPESNIIDVIYGSLAWIDLDNDNDLDLIEIGYGTEGGGSGNSTVKAFVYLSNRSLTKNNTQPNASTSGFSSSYTNNVLTLSWGNGSDVETNTSGLYYNLMVGNTTNNHSIVSGVYGGSSNPTAGYFGNMMQRKSISLNVELEANKTYNWYVQTIDTGLAKSNWSAMQSFNTSADTTKPNITIENPSPNNTLHTTNPFFTFNITVTDNQNVSNVSLYADWTGSMIINETNSSGINGTYIFERNLTNIADGQYSWHIEANDTYNNSQTSGTRSFYLDREYPFVYLIGPADSSTSTSASVSFSYNVTDTDIANCSLIIDNSLDQTDTSVSEDTTQTFTKTMSNGNYNWYVNCSDYVSYTNSSGTRSLTVSYSSGNGGNGGGGGGGSSTTTTTTITPTPQLKDFDIDFSNLPIGDSRSLEAEQGDVKTFSFNSKTKHSITTLTLNKDSVTLLITSDPITLQLSLGETKQIDINKDNINDLEIKLVSITDGVADLIFKKLEGADIVGKEELGKEVLFDVKLDIVNLFEIIKSGREVIAEIEVFNINNIGQVDVIIDYYITSKKDNQTKLAEGSDTLAIEAVTSFVRSLAVPYDTKSGKYLFNVDVRYKDKIMASGHAEFRVIRNYEIIIAVGIVVLIVVGIFVYLRRIKGKEEKLEKEVKALKRKPWRIWGKKIKRRKNGSNKNR